MNSRCSSSRKSQRARSSGSAMGCPSRPRTSTSQGVMQYTPKPGMVWVVEQKPSSK